MIVARFQFHPDRVEEFSYGGEFVEMQLDELDDTSKVSANFDIDDEELAQLQDQL